MCEAEEAGGVEQERDNEWLKLSTDMRLILILGSDGIQQCKASAAPKTHTAWLPTMRSGLIQV